MKYIYFTHDGWTLGACVAWISFFEISFFEIYVGASLSVGAIERDYTTNLGELKSHRHGWGCARGCDFILKPQSRNRVAARTLTLRVYFL